jgi:hypothetical protein
MVSQSDMINITTGEARCGYVRSGQVRSGPVRAFSSSSLCIASRVWSGVRTPRLLGPSSGGSACFLGSGEASQEIINPANMVASALCIE